MSKQDRHAASKSRHHHDAGFRAEWSMGLGEALCCIGLGAVAAGAVMVMWWGLA